MSTTTCIVIMAVCLMLSAYFSATETAFSSANTTRLKTLAEKGNKRAALVCKLLERYDRDVLSLEPDYVSICIGINDVWRQFDVPGIPSEACTPDEYEHNLREMIERTRDKVLRLFLATPYFMEPCRADRMRARMDEYSDIVRRLASEYVCELVDFQAAYDRFFEHKHSAIIAWDRVHPNQIGATLMAREFLSHCGFDYDHMPVEK